MKRQTRVGRRSALLSVLVFFGCCFFGFEVMAQSPALPLVNSQVDQSASAGEINVDNSEEVRIERIRKTGLTVTEKLAPNGTQQELRVRFEPKAAFGFRTPEPEVADEMIESIIARAFPDICGLSGLNELDMTGCMAFGDAHLAALPVTMSLKRLNLFGTGITDKGAHEVSKQANVETIALNETKVTDIGIKSIADLARLRVLRASSTQITDLGVAYLAKVSSLRRLDLADTAVTSDGINSLKGCRLHSLELTNTRIDDQCAKTLARMAEIRVLLLDGTRLSAKGCSLILRSKAEVLHLSRTAIDDSSLVNLFNPHVQTLFLDDTNVTDEGLVHLKACTALRFLSVERTKVTEEGVRKMNADNPSLKMNWRSEADDPTVIQEVPSKRKPQIPL